MMNQNNLVYNPVAFYGLLNYLNLMYPNSGYNLNNYNIYNANYNMQIMQNWMNMNPLLATVYQNMLNQCNMNMNIPQNQSPPQFVNQNNINNINNANMNNANNMNNMNNANNMNNSNNMSNNTKVYSMPSYDDSPKINIAFTTQKGKKMNIICSYNTKIKELFTEYMQKIGLGPGVIGNDFYFLYNGSKFDQNDNRTVGELGLNSFCTFIVIDTKDIIGA